MSLEHENIPLCSIIYSRTVRLIIFKNILIPICLFSWEYIICQFGNDRSQRTFITTPKKTTRDIVHQKCELAVPPNRNHYTMLDYSEKRHLWTLYALMTSVTHTKVETSSPNTFLIGLLLRHLVNDWLSFSISWSWNHDYSREKTVYKWEFPWCIDTMMITMNHSNNHSML